MSQDLLDLRAIHKFEPIDAKTRKYLGYSLDLNGVEVEFHSNADHIIVATVVNSWDDQKVQDDINAGKHRQIPMPILYYNLADGEYQCDCGRYIDRVIIKDRQRVKSVNRDSKTQELFEITYYLNGQIVKRETYRERTRSGYSDGTPITYTYEDGWLVEYRATDRLEYYYRGQKHGKFVVEETGQWFFAGWYTMEHGKLKGPFRLELDGFGTITGCYNGRITEDTHDIENVIQDSFGKPGYGFSYPGLMGTFTQETIDYKYDLYYIQHIDYSNEGKRNGWMLTYHYHHETQSEGMNREVRAQEAMKDTLGFCQSSSTYIEENNKYVDSYCLVQYYRDDAEISALSVVKMIDQYVLQELEVPEVSRMLRAYLF